MKRHVGDFVRRCLTCQQVKAENQKPVRLLQPLEVVEWKWEHVTMKAPKMVEKFRGEILFSLYIFLFHSLLLLYFLTQ